MRTHHIAVYQRMSLDPEIIPPDDPAAETHPENPQMVLGFHHPTALQGYIY
ncbi:Uncharacterised protein [Yersinia enterocolitica]|nr:Uncharacterised protein [Yersinia enterocolitica]